MAAKPNNPKDSLAPDVGAKVEKDKPKFLVALPESTVKKLKIQAIEKGKPATASSVLEEAVQAWMKVHGDDPSPPAEGPEKGERQFLSQMDGKLIEEVKLKATKWKITASAIVRVAALEWLGKQGLSTSSK